MNSPPLVQLENVSVTLAGQRALDRVSWRLGAGEHWAVLGGNGSGKSTLLKLIRGDLWPDPDRTGRRTYGLPDGPSASPVGLRESVALVSPELQDRYLQQEWMQTGEQVVRTGWFHTDYLCQPISPGQKARATALMEELGIAHLRRRNVQQLSQGELRRVLIARALVGGPRVLILDEFCDGLDAVTRRQLLALVERVARNGTQVLYTTHRAGELIPAVSHVLVLDAGAIVWQGTRRAWSRRMKCAGDASPPNSIRKAGKQEWEGWCHRSSLPAFLPSLFNSHLSPACAGPLRRGSLSPASRPSAESPDTSLHATPLFRLCRASVFLERQRVLQSLDWQMNRDENWAILGRNGAGKSTFLKLLSGDLHPAVGGSVERFAGEPRTLWQLRRRLGFVSGDFQAAYRPEQTGEDVLASGFFSSVGLVDQPTAKQRARVRELAERFQLRPFIRQKVTEMSYGQLRRVLMARALVHWPQVLIFDEPFDGLDAASKADLQHALEQTSHDGTRLLIVTHHWEDLPRCMTHALVLERGRITNAGPLSDASMRRQVAQLFTQAGE